MFSEDKSQNISAYVLCDQDGNVLQGSADGSGASVTVYPDRISAHVKRHEKLNVMADDDQRILMIHNACLLILENADEQPTQSTEQQSVEETPIDKRILEATLMWQRAGQLIEQLQELAPNGCLSNMPLDVRMPWVHPINSLTIFCGEMLDLISHLCKQRDTIQVSGD